MPPPTPNTIAFEVTPRCDQRCGFCYNVWKGACGDRYPTGELPTAELCSLISRAVDESGGTELVVTGGEPLLREDALAILAHASSRARGVTLITSARRLTPAIADELARLGNVSVQVTLLAGRREVHDALRGVAGFDAALEAMTCLRERRVPLVLCFVCTRENHAELGGVLDLAHALGVGALSFNRMAPAGEAARQLERLAPTVEMLEGCLALAEAAARDRGLRVSTALPIPP